MIPCKPTIQKLTFLILSLFVFSVVTVSAQDGKAIFTSKCASCHHPVKAGTGPALGGMEERHKWADHKELLAWIQNPGAYMAKDPYTQGLLAQYKSMMTGFPDFTLEDVNAVVSYVNQEYTRLTQPKAPGDTAGAEAGGGNQNSIIFGIISLILAIIALILMQVNSNLKKMSDDVEGIQRPEPVAFYKNKVYIAMAAILLFIVGGFYVTKGAIGLQRQTNYQPEQPIYYSHKVHAGINQINCLYCHGNAWDGKTAAIPSVNVCMNCHKTITTYEQGPKLYDNNGKEINGTAEIAKL
ncbi:MAG TPA: c-type cytochrome, partial [Chitinophagaceae bacterium]|nr:c-type cytochrome [Chitinophagaceae bacterium]